MKHWEKWHNQHPNISPHFHKKCQRANSFSTLVCGSGQNAAQIGTRSMSAFLGCQACHYSGIGGGDKLTTHQPSSLSLTLSLPFSLSLPLCLHISLPTGRLLCRSFGKCQQVLCRIRFHRAVCGVILSNTHTLSAIWGQLREWRGKGTIKQETGLISVQH